MLFRENYDWLLILYDMKNQDESPELNAYFI